MEAKAIQKYNKYTVAKLLKKATHYFNLYIRLRDTDENGIGNCISSGRTLQTPSKNAQAGHFYSAGHYSILRFNEDNVHLQSLSDNYFKSGNQLEYRKNLLRKIGEEKVQELDNLAQNKRPFKWDRFSLIEIIENYKEQSKALLNLKK